VGKLAEKLRELGWELVDTVEFPGAPTPSDLERLRELGRKVAEAVAQKSR
jgi:flavorubredoxin